MKLNDIAIKNKLLLFMLFSFVIPMILLPVLFIRQFYGSFLAKATSMLEISVEQLEGNLSALLLSQKRAVQQVAENPAVIQYVEAFYLHDYDSYSDYREKVVPFLEPLEEHGLTITVYNHNKTLKTAGAFSRRINELTWIPWSERSPASQERYYWKYHPPEYPMAPSSLACYRNAFDMNMPGRLTMVVSAALEERELRLLLETETRNGRAVFLANEENTVIASTDPGLVGKPAGSLSLPPARQARDDGEGGGTVLYEGAEYLFFRRVYENTELNISGWEITYLIPYHDLADELSGLVRTFATSMIAFLAVALLGTVFLARNLTGRLGRLMSNIRRVGGGDLTPGDSIPGTDEIGQIDQTFHHMVNQVNELIRSVYEYRIRAMNDDMERQQLEMERKEAVILFLQRQINPHYLYNTLETIRMRMTLGQTEESADMIRVFAESLREYTDTRGDYQTVEREVSFLRKYIVIQQFRFGERFGFDIYVDEGLAKARIPRFVLQPLVENAFSHGLEPKVGQGSVLVELYPDGQDIVVTVTDDGVGMEQETLERLREAVARDMAYGNPGRGKDSFGIGLRNVNARIGLLYGPDYRMRIESRPGRGTEITLRMRGTWEEE